MLAKEEKLILQDFPKVKEELEQTIEFLGQLANSKETVSGDRYKQLENKYNTKISELKAKREKIIDQFEEKKDELKIHQGTLQNRRKETSNNLNEITQLKEQGAISDDDYKQQSRQYNNELKAIDKESAQINKDFEEIDFYFNAKGDVNFHREKIFSAVSDSKTNMSELINKFGFPKAVKSRVSVYRENLKEAFRLPKWSKKLTGQLTVFSIIMIIVFFLPWAFSAEEFEDISDSELLWSWHVDSFSSKIEGEIRRAGYNLQDELNSKYFKLEDYLEDNYREKFDIDKSEYEIKRDLFKISELLRNFRMPSSSSPIFYLVVGLILFLIIVTFRKKLTGWYSVFLSLIILFVFYVFSNLGQFIEFNSIINQYSKIWHYLQNGIYRDIGYNSIVLSQNKIFLNWAIFLIGFSGALLMYKHKLMFIIKITLGLSIIFSILYFLLPININGNKYSWIYWIIKTFEEQNSVEYAIILIAHITLATIVLLIPIIKLLNIKQYLLNTDNEKFSWLIIWPIIFSLISLLVVFTAINFDDFEIVIIGLFYFLIISSFLWVWFMQIVGYVFSALIYSIQKTITKN